MGTARSDVDIGTQSVADLIVTALRHERVPRAEDSLVWRTIELLLADVDPTREREKTASWRHAEDHGIDTIRGRALEAAALYARWVLKAKRAGGLPPYVAMALEARIAVEDAPAVRAIFGWWFGLLHFLDPTWAEAHTESLFGGDRAFTRAVFGAFLRWNSPSHDLYRNSRSPVPRRHRGDGPHLSPADVGMREHLQRLAQHLAELSWLGVISFGDADGLLELFFARAPALARHEFFEFIGRAVWRSKKLPENMADRLMVLWTTRASALADASAESIRPKRRRLAGGSLPASSTPLGSSRTSQPS